jgi:hypothetical protein
MYFRWKDSLISLIVQRILQHVSRYEERSVAPSVRSVNGSLEKCGEILFSTTEKIGRLMRMK